MLPDPQVNLRCWNERARIHARDTTGFYQADRFLRGADTLFPIESEEIGDIAGKSLLHLQCHIGLDTLSLARRGAHVTGIDFSPVAIEAARDFASRSGLAACFIESDIYDAAAATGRQYEIAYATWGTIVWLPDVYRWTRTVAAILSGRGRLYFLDTHPYAQMLEESTAHWSIDIPGELPAKRKMCLRTKPRTRVIPRLWHLAELMSGPTRSELFFPLSSKPA